MEMLKLKGAEGLTAEIQELHDNLKEQALENFFFDTPSVYEGFTYKVIGDDLAVLEYEPDVVKDGKLVIPDVFDRLETDEERFKLNNDVTDIDLGTIGVVGKGMFMGTSLESVTGKYVQVVSEQAFKVCPNLRNVDLPNVIAIGQEAFLACKNLIELKFPSLRIVSDATFAHCENLESCDIHGVRMAGGNTGIKEAPESVFEGCIRLKNLDISGALILGVRCLAGCISLTELRVRLCRAFESQALIGCENLKSIYIDNLLGLKEKCLKGCDNLANVYYYGDRERWSQVMIEDECELNVMKQANIVLDYKDPEEEKAEK